MSIQRHKLSFNAAFAIFVALNFLLLGAVLVISQESEANATAINVAGSQRALSQRLHRVLLQLHQVPPVYQDARLQELAKTVAVFDSTLLAFSNGGLTRDANDRPVVLKRLSSKISRQHLDHGLTTWLNFSKLLSPWVGMAVPTPDQVAAALAFAQEHNTDLFDDMDQLTSQLVQGQRAQMSEVRLIQCALLVLMLMAGAVILMQKRRLMTALDAENNSLQQHVNMARAELSVTQEQLAQSMGMSSDLIWVKDVTGVYTYCNAPFEKYVGLSAQQIIGKTDHDLVSPELAEQYQKADRQALLEMAPIFSEERHVSLDKRYDGLFEIVKLPLHDHHGHVTGVQGVGRDITKQREAQLALKAAHERLKLLETCISQIKEVVVITEADPIDFPGPRIVYVNNAFERVTGYSRSEVLGKSLSMLQGPKTQRHEIDRLRRTIATGVSDCAEVINYTKSGEEYWVEIQVMPVANDQGKFTHWISIRRDITKRKQNESEILELMQLSAESSRLKSEFLRNVTHELRTPMNGVMGMCQVLEMTELDKQQKLYVKTLHGSANAFLKVINSVLDFRNIDEGTLTLEDKSFDMRAMLAACCDKVRGLADVKQLALHNLCDPAIPTHLWGDGRRISQVLDYLLDNAVKFTAKGSVSLSVSLTRGDVNTFGLRFEVQDTGIGIPPQEMTRLFRPFVQLDGTMTRRYGGTGLGLAISRKLVELMHGHLLIDSAADQGSRFWFELELHGVDVTVLPEELEGAPVAFGRECAP